MGILSGLALLSGGDQRGDGRSEKREKRDLGPLHEKRVGVKKNLQVLLPRSRSRRQRKGPRRGTGKGGKNDGSCQKKSPFTERKGKARGVFAHWFKKRFGGRTEQKEQAAEREVGINDRGGKTSAESKILGASLWELVLRAKRRSGVESAIEGNTPEGGLEGLVRRHPQTSDDRKGRLSQRRRKKLGPWKGDERSSQRTCVRLTPGKFGR